MLKINENEATSPKNAFGPPSFFPGFWSRQATRGRENDGQRCEGR